MSQSGTSHVNFMPEILGYSTLCWWVCDKKTRKSHSSRFCLRILWETSWLSFCLFSWVLCVDCCHSLIVLMVITNTVTTYTEVWRFKASMLYPASSQPPLCPPPQPLVSAILEGVTFCLMIIHSHLSLPVPSERLCGCYPGIHVCTAVSLERVRESSSSATFLSVFIHYQSAAQHINHIYSLSYISALFSLRTLITVLNFNCTVLEDYNIISVTFFKFSIIPWEGGKSFNSGL